MSFNTEPKRIIRVEPIFEPVPSRHTPEPMEPVKQPEQEPVLVPDRGE